MKRLYSPSLPYCLMVAAFSWFGVSLAPAAVDYFLKIEGIPGESADMHHRGWIEIESFSHGMSRAATYGTPGTERSTLGDIVVTKAIDRASPLLYKALCSGQVLTSATLELRRTYGVNPVPQTYLRIHLEDVVITSVNSSAKGEGEPVLAEHYHHMEQVSFVYHKISWTYTERNPDTGEPIAEVTSGWDAAADQPLNPTLPGSSWLAK